MNFNKTSLKQDEIQRSSDSLWATHYTSAAETNETQDNNSVCVCVFRILRTQSHRSELFPIYLHINNQLLSCYKIYAQPMY